jgi:hypothetical protein
MGRHNTRPGRSFLDFHESGSWPKEIVQHTREGGIRWKLKLGYWTTRGQLPWPGHFGLLLTADSIRLRYTHDLDDRHDIYEYELAPEVMARILEAVILEGNYE